MPKSKHKWSQRETAQRLQMERFDINIYEFIEEVKKRRAVWDSTSEEYTDRDARKKSWSELVELFGDCDGEAAMSTAKKKETEFLLMKKWKNIRTCFTRELKRQKRKHKRTGRTPKNSYKYFPKLTFLLGVVHSRTSRDTDSDASEETSNTDKKDKPVATEYAEIEFDEIDDPESDEWLSSYNATHEKSSKKSKLQLKVEPETETNFIDMNLVERRQLTEESDDEDKLFLLSLLSTMKLVPREKKMSTRIKIMTILNEATQVSYKYGEMPCSSNT